MSPVDAVTDVPVDVPWGTRVREDGLRASALQTSVQREITATILQRALAEGVEAVVLTGSTVRARRTAVSDLDFMIVGERPDCSGVHEDVDVSAASAEAFWRRLIAGDDYIQWTLRFGCILHDDGILLAASRYI
ncbi:MAG TPA: hypothetical protein VIJ76_08215, partial [Galbitalea sp.]